MISSRAGERASAALLACALAACHPSRAPSPWERESPLLPLPSPPLGVQADDAQLPFSLTPAKVRLGRWLFFDRRLSAGGAIACADCHAPAHAFSERTPVSTGTAGHKGTRKAPALINVAFPLFENYFRDGRAASLVEQAIGPIENPIEMGATAAKSTAAIAAVPGYARAFRDAFPDAPADPVDIHRIAEALASYEATRLSGDSAFDRFDAGDSAALNPTQQAGRAVFYGKAACTQCHLGWNFTDWRFHNLGVGWRGAPVNGDPATAFADLGRGKTTGRSEDSGAFKTPTLRDVAKHPPYMHDGSLATLRDVVLLYNRGGNANPYLSPKLKPLGLDDAEIDALVAFLESLDGRGYADTAPDHFPQ